MDVIRRILVTGTEEYLGSFLAPEPIRHGYEVTGRTLASTRSECFICDGGITPLTLVKDLRQVEADDLKGIDAVVHMAEVSNCPAGQLAPAITYEINHRGSVHLAELARRAEVKRFVYMSSCSVYGVAEGKDVMRGLPRFHRPLMPSARSW